MQHEVYLTLIRHGQSQWNLENRFTGWVDVELTQEGILEAERAASRLKDLNITYHLCHASVLKRSIHTLWIVLKGLNVSWLPTQKAWELNERHYGALQGLNKKETEDKYGADQVKIWRRSYDTSPPLLDRSKVKDLNPKEAEKYNQLGLESMPLGESLKTCQGRVVPYFKNIMKPQLQSGKNLLVVAHGNSLRSLIMEIENLSGEKIMEVEIETAVPIIYKLSIDTKSGALKLISKNILK